MSKATLLTRTQLLAHAMCSDDKFRPALQNLHVAAEFFATLAKMLKEDGQNAQHVTLRIPANGKGPIRADATSYDHTFLDLLMPTLVPAASK